jgi:hypothetical protein
MGGERERAELAAFETLLSKCIADHLVAQVRKEAEVHGVDVLTWLTRDRSHGEAAATARAKTTATIANTPYGGAHCYMRYRERQQITARAAPASCRRTKRDAATGRVQRG